MPTGVVRGIRSSILSGIGNLTAVDRGPHVVCIRKYII